MKLTLIRTIRTDRYTAGELFIDGQFFCYTLEDPDRGLRQTDPIEKIRKVKVPGQTAIPTGTYRVVNSMSQRFGRVMPLLKDVPGFTGVRIHSGNTTDDTHGCLLLGKKDPLHRGRLIESRATVKAFEEIFNVFGEAEIEIVYWGKDSVKFV